MYAPCPGRRAVLAGTAAAGAPAHRWRSAVIGGTGFVTGVLFHAAVRGLGHARTGIGGAYRWDNRTARSDDGAKSWVRINDDAHQWGFIGEVIVGDPRVYGRVDLATNGRVIQYGEIV